MYLTCKPTSSEPDSPPHALESIYYLTWVSYLIECILMSHLIEHIYCDRVSVKYKLDVNI